MVYINFGCFWIFVVSFNKRHSGYGYFFFFIKIFITCCVTMTYDCFIIVELFSPQFWHCYCNMYDVRKTFFENFI